MKKHRYIAEKELRQRRVDSFITWCTFIFLLLPGFLFIVLLVEEWLMVVGQ